MTNLSLERFARRLRIAALAGAVVIPGLTLIAGLAPRSIVHADLGGLPLAWGIAAAMASALLLAAGLAALAAMLGHVARGETFAPAATRHFRHFAGFLLLAALANMLLPPLFQAALAFAGKTRSIAFEFSDQDFVTLLVALVLFLVARLFDEAARLDEDSRSIV